MSINRAISRSDDQVVQRYVDKPMLIDGKKHDLRLYVTITSVEPLIAYINEEGLARFCVEDYELPTDQNKEINGMHLTNYSLSKHNEGYIHSEELEKIHNGSKRTLKSYWASVEQAGYDVIQVIFNLKKDERRYC